MFSSLVQDCLALDQQKGLCTKLGFLQQQFLSETNLQFSLLPLFAVVYVSSCFALKKPEKWRKHNRIPGPVALAAVLMYSSPKRENKFLYHLKCQKPFHIKKKSVAKGIKWWFNEIPTISIALVGFFLFPYCDYKILEISNTSITARYVTNIYSWISLEFCVISNVFSGA